MKTLKLECGAEIVHHVEKRKINIDDQLYLHILEIIDSDMDTIGRVHDENNNKTYDNITSVEIVMASEALPKVIRFLQEIESNEKSIKT